MPRTADPWDDWENADYSRSSASSSNLNDAANDNARLWQIANSSLSLGPSMTASTNIVSSSHHQQHLYNGSIAPSSAGGAALPPPQAYMGSLKILKRPDSGRSSGATSPNGSGDGGSRAAAAAAAAAKTLKDRERAYMEARTRIFGEGEKDKDTPKTSSALGSPASNPASASASLPLAVANLSIGDGSEAIQQSEGSSAPQQSLPANPVNRNSKSGIRRTAAAAASGTGSGHASGTSTPPNGSSTHIIREPVNPPTNSHGTKTAKDAQREKGFNTARRSKPKKALNAAAVEFKPRGSTPTNA